MVKVTKENYKEAFTEIDEIIKNMPKELNKRISKNFKDFIEKNKDLEYNFKLIPNKSLLEQNLKKETKILLSLIYRSYICSEEEKKKLINEDKEILKIEEEKLNKKYNPNNIFVKKDVNSNLNIENENIKDLVVKENFFNKVINKILKIINKLKK